MIRGLMGMCDDAFQGVRVWAVRHGSDLNKIIICLILMNQMTDTHIHAQTHTHWVLFLLFFLTTTWKLTVYPTTYFHNLWQLAIKLADTKHTVNIHKITHTQLPVHTLRNNNTDTHTHKQSTLTAFCRQAVRPLQTILIVLLSFRT